MHRLRKQRVIIYTSFLLCISIAVALVLYALQEKVDFFYTPAEIYVDKNKLMHRSFRLGGLVKPNSVHRSEALLYFTVMDKDREIQVVYQGIIPDLFQEGKGVVAEGRLHQAANDTISFTANRVLAKHDENYMPPAIQQKLAD